MFNEGQKISYELTFPVNEDQIQPLKIFIKYLQEIATAAETQIEIDKKKYEGIRSNVRMARRLKTKVKVNEPTNGFATLTP